jgi:hypothetical protein
MRPKGVTAVTLVPSGSVADVSCMVVAADLPVAHGFGLSPELVLVDAALAAEVRHLLVVPEDTLERLERGGDRRRPASQEAAPLPEPDDYSVAEHEHTEFSEDDVAVLESGKHSTASDSETSQPAPAPELADPIRRKDVPSADQVIEPTTADESAQGQQASNTYPTLPAPPPEYPQEDATDAVLRLITRSA